MSIVPHLLTIFYERLLLKRPRLILFLLLVVVAFLGYKAKDFKLDASTQTLILQTDEDLRYSQMIQSRFGGYDYLLLTYTPIGDLFSNQALQNLKRLSDELKKVDSVSEVISILDAPLLESPPVPVKQLATSIQTLESPAVDRKRARVEFAESPLYRDLLSAKISRQPPCKLNFGPMRRIRICWPGTINYRKKG
jgi:predicted RND superfamily exporter protein